MRAISDKVAQKKTGTSLGALVISLNPERQKYYISDADAERHDTKSYSIGLSNPSVFVRTRNDLTPRHAGSEKIL